MQRVRSCYRPLTAAANRTGSLIHTDFAAVRHATRLLSHTGLGRERDARLVAVMAIRSNVRRPVNVSDRTPSLMLAVAKGNGRVIALVEMVNRLPILPGSVQSGRRRGWAMSSAENRVLIVEDDDAVAMVLKAGLLQEQIATERASSAEDALRLLDRLPVDAILSDVRMPGMSGIELLARLQKRWPETPVVLVTAHGTVPLAVEAMKQGAMDFLTKPFDLDEVVAVVRRALAVAARQRTKVPSIPVSPNVVATRSPAMLGVEAVLAKAAHSDCTVLLLGESGVGKEVAARFLHGRGPRAQKPFVALHCGALPDELLESELFGYERGAFTGAAARKPGRFELAEGGTLFLDEIGETSPSTQVKLLRVLQEKTFERLGGVTTLKANVRFVAATHRDLRSLVVAGAFREDLYYRLSVFPICLPPLRERREDIVPLIEHFARICGNDRRPTNFETAALGLLAEQTWPGNVRELQNFVERMVLLADGPTIGLAEVGAELALRSNEMVPFAPGRPADDESTLDARRRRAELEGLKKALDRSGGNRTQAARLLGISRRTLYNKLAEYELESVTADEVARR
jgi:two-component system response regulator AtoC